MRWYGHGLVLSQDVFLENGRCAWAIEWLLDRRIGPPFFTEELAKDKKKLEEQIKVYTYKVIEAMDLPRRTGEEKPKKQFRTIPNPPPGQN